MSKIQERNQGFRRLAKELRNELAIRLYNEYGMPIDIIGDALGMNKTSIYRIVKKDILYKGK